MHAWVHACIYNKLHYEVSVIFRTMPWAGLAQSKPLQYSQGNTGTGIRRTEGFEFEFVWSISGPFQNRAS